MGDKMTLRALVVFEAIWPDSTWRDAARTALREMEAKDATIKALADALEAAKVAMHRGEFGQMGRDRDVPKQVDDALRLAGRIK